MNCIISYTNGKNVKNKYRKDPNPLLYLTIIVFTV